MAQLPVAVVTGANRGIGEAIARELSARGLGVVATSREVGDHFVPLDVTRAESVASLADRLRDNEGGIDVLVNNAGASFDGFDADVAERTLDVNFFGAVRVTDGLLPLMRNGGRIIMVSSGMGTLDHVRGAVRARFEASNLSRPELVELMRSFVRAVASNTYETQGWPRNAYSVSKVGMNAFVRVLARELATDPRRIAVNAVCPGWVRTRMGGSSAPRSAQAGARTPVWLALQPEGGPTGGFFRDERAIPW
jgi:carbonyl reductase 1